MLRFNAMYRHGRATVFVALFIGLMIMLSGPAWASDWSNDTLAAHNITWLQATLLALSGVVVLGLVGFSSFQLCRALRWIPTEQEFQLSRRLQTTFGAMLLMAATMPYLFIHAPIIAVSLFVLVIGSGFIASASAVDTHQLPY